MPELGELRSRGIQPIVFQPQSPAAYFDRRLPDAPVVDTSALSKSQAIGAIAKTIGTLPEQIVENYNRGYNLGRAREAASDPNAEVSYGADGAMTVKPMSKMTADLNSAKIDSEQAEAALKRSLVGSDPFSQVDRAYRSGAPSSGPSSTTPSTTPKTSRPMASFGPVEPDMPQGIPPLTHDTGLPSPDDVESAPPHGSDLFPMASFGLSQPSMVDQSASASQVRTPAPSAISNPVGKEGDQSLIPGLDDSSPKPDGMSGKRPMYEPVPGMIGADGKTSAYYYRPDATTTLMFIKGRKDPIQIHEPAKSSTAAFDTPEQLDAYYADHGQVASKKFQDGDGKWHAAEAVSSVKLDRQTEKRLAELAQMGHVVTRQGKSPDQIAAEVSNEEKTLQMVPDKVTQEFLAWHNSLKSDPVVKDYYTAHNASNAVDAALSGGLNPAAALAVIDKYVSAMRGGAATQGMTHILEDAQTARQKLPLIWQKYTGGSGENSILTQNMADDVKHIMGKIEQSSRKEVEAQREGSKKHWSSFGVPSSAIDNSYESILGVSDSSLPVLPDSEKPSVPSPSPDSADPVASAQDRAIAFTNKRTSEISELLSDYSSGKFDSSPENKEKAERVLRANGAIK